MKRALFWSIGGALLAAPFAMLHIVTGVIVTPQGALSLADWWGAFLYAGAGLLLGFGHRHVVMPRTAGAGMPGTTTLGALAGVAPLVFAYASSSFAQEAHPHALAAYVGVWSLGVTLVDRRARSTLIVFSLAAATIATSFEIALASTGAFSYGQPDVFGVAMWLPGIYLNAGLAAHLVDRRLLAVGSAASHS